MDSGKYFMAIGSFEHDPEISAPQKTYYLGNSIPPLARVDAGRLPLKVTGETL